MKTIKINPTDNVAVSVDLIKAGSALEVDGVEITALSDIPPGHKIAIRDISKDSEVIKYGYPIGQATDNIKFGEHVHTHNVTTLLEGQLEYTYQPIEMSEIAGNGIFDKAAHFMGYKRENGTVGIRNEIWVIPTNGCVNSTVMNIAKNAEKLLKGNIDGVYAFPHPYGCSQYGDDHERTKRTLCSIARHPNAGGVLIVGLGCENNHIQGMREMLSDVDESRIKFLNTQDVNDEFEEADTLMKEIIDIVAHDKRESVPMSELIVGLECGGSDGFSGITANPLLGVFTDRIINEGGSVILTEVPEMFGAETILMNRCINEEVFQKTVDLINNFKAYFINHNQPVYENPSYGNRLGGITTLEDKSLGCTQKAGSAKVVDVLAYSEILQNKGLNLLNAAGNDLVASTALAASGAHILLFTTGRGTPYGAPIPTVKISSNTELYKKKPGWIDFDAGALLVGISMNELSDEFYNYIVKVLNGEVLTKTEINNARDLTIFKTGVTA